MSETARDGCLGLQISFSTAPPSNLHTSPAAEQPPQEMDADFFQREEEVVVPSWDNDTTWVPRFHIPCLQDEESFIDESKLGFRSHEYDGQSWDCFNGNIISPFRFDFACA